MLNKVKGSALLFVLLILALLLSGGIFYFLQKERARSTELQAELDDIKTKQRITEKELTDSRSRISILEASLQQSDDKIKELDQSLEQEKGAKAEALTKIEELRADLDRQKGSSVELEEKLVKAQKDMDKVKGQLREMEARRTELESKIQQLEANADSNNNVELGTIVVNPENSPNRTKPEPVPDTKNEKLAVMAANVVLEGKVLVINKDYSFAVINLGSKDGVGLGDIFSVYHNNKYVGDIKVEKTHDSMSAAGFLSPDLKTKVNEGDKVVVKTK